MEPEAKPKSMTDSWLTLCYEKLSRGYGMSIEEVKSAIITIKDGQVTVTKGKK